MSRREDHGEDLAGESIRRKIVQRIQAMSLSSASKAIREAEAALRAHSYSCCLGKDTVQPFHRRRCRLLMAKLVEVC